MVGATAPRPLLRFRIAGIPVDVRPMFVVVVAAGAFQYRSPAGAAVWIAVVSVSVLWHEMGHALTMRAFGHPARIELHAMGGLAHWPAGASPGAREALLVSAAGPGAGLLLGAGVWLLARSAGPLPFLVSLAIQDALWVNVAWSLFNLLPILPLDGAHVLDELSRLANGAVRPGWVGWASIITGGGVALLAVSRSSPYVALLGLIGAAQGVSRIRGVEQGSSAGRGAGADARSVDEARIRARRAISRGNLSGAVSALLPEARVGSLAEQDLAQLVDLLVRLGRFDELVALCRDRLSAFARRRDAEPLARLASAALADEGADEEALAVSQAAFRQLNIAYHAYDAACHLVRLEQHDEAVRWLESAIEARLDCGEALLTDPALDPLRERADFRDLVSRVGARPTTA